MKKGKEKCRSWQPDVKDCLNWYTHHFYCQNCSDRNLRWIKRGTLVKAVTVTFDNCGCKIQ